MGEKYAGWESREWRGRALEYWRSYASGELVYRVGTKDALLINRIQMETLVIFVPPLYEYPVEKALEMVVARMRETVKRDLLSAVEVYTDRMKELR